MTITTTVAQAAEIICPPWCVVDRREHQASLREWEGRCLHQSQRLLAGADSDEFYLASMRWPDGSPDESEPHVSVQAGGATISATAAEKFAHQLLELARQARQGACAGSTRREHDIRRTRIVDGDHELVLDTQGEISLLIKEPDPTKPGRFRDGEFGFAEGGYLMLRLDVDGVHSVVHVDAPGGADPGEVLKRSSGHLKALSDRLNALQGVRTVQA